MRILFGNKLCSFEISLMVMNFEEGYVKWFMNCFMVWSWEKCYYILKEYLGINNVEVSKVLGVVWWRFFE